MDCVLLIFVKLPGGSIAGGHDKSELSSMGWKMKQISINYKMSNSGLSDVCQADYTQRLEPEIARIRMGRSNYDTPYAFLHTPWDLQAQQHVLQLAEQKSALCPVALFVIGIGGSSWGSQAVLHALYGIAYNDTNPQLRVYFVDTIDSDYVHNMLSIAQSHLQLGEHVIVNIVSKSGATIEIIANMSLFIQLLEQYEKDRAYQYVVVTTGQHSSLWEYALQMKFATLVIPTMVGGRYSVFSCAGLFPLALAGIAIEQLCAGGAYMAQQCGIAGGDGNMAAYCAAVLVNQYAMGKQVHDTFLFSADFESIGQWYRQLLAESIGKRFDNDGNEVNVGMLPTVSVGPRDLHSVAQLYLAGPNNFFTTFVTVNNALDELQIPPGKNLSVDQIVGRTLSEVSQAIAYATMDAYATYDRAYLLLEVPEKSAYCIGQLLMSKMIETVYVGYLLEVNPFDQPEVELYKTKTKNLLAR